jgi:hypothetical protein
MDAIFSIIAVVVFVYWIWSVQYSLENLNQRLILVRKAIEDIQKQINKKETK